MNKVFLLTGKARTGKSTAIKAIIDQLGSEICGGFYTEEIRDTQDRIGFNCVTISGERQVIASVNSGSSLKIGRYGVEIGQFEDLPLPAIHNSLKVNQVTVIDEIGFIQMLSVPFRNLIQEIVLGGEHIIVGTVCVDSHPVIDNIKKAPSVQLYTMTEANRDFIPDLVVRDLLRVNH
jgi:nucleoside-triphosphatase